MSLLSFKYLIQKEHSSQVRVYENILKMQVCRHRSLYHGEQALPGVRNSSCTSRCSTGHPWPRPRAAGGACAVFAFAGAGTGAGPTSGAGAVGVSIDQRRALWSKAEEEEAWSSQAFTVGKFHVEFQISSCFCKMRKTWQFWEHISQRQWQSRLRSSCHLCTDTHSACPRSPRHSHSGRVGFTQFLPHLPVSKGGEQFAESQRVGLEPETMT